MAELQSLEKCIASVEDTKQNYTSMADLDVDPAGKLMYSKLVTASTKHLDVLYNRLEDLKQQENYLDKLR
ncbi:MAG: hypothetical protein WDA53_02570 [Bacillota bacterium]